MIDNKLGEALDNLQVFLIDEKNRKLFFIILLSMFFLITSFTVLGITINRNKYLSRQQVVSPTPIPTDEPLPTRKTAKNALASEVIKSVVFSINCQITVATSEKKVSLQKYESCNKPLKTFISSSGKFAGYYYPSNEGKISIYIYSLDNNIEALLEVFDELPTDMLYLQKDNLGILTNNKFIYYNIPLLFQKYPENFDINRKIFTDLEKYKVIIDLSEITKSFEKIKVIGSIIQIIGKSQEVLFSITLDDLIRQLTPTPADYINRKQLDWSKRILIYDNLVFKTVNPDGSVGIKHTLKCDGQEILPIGFYEGFFSRSPDGTLLSFLIPTNSQMIDNPNWKVEILSKRKVFNEGEIVIYDLVRDKCERINRKQSLKYKENMAFSPDGRYLAYVYEGLYLYQLSEKTAIQLTNHRSDDSILPSYITGPLMWDANSKFIFMAISVFKDNTINSTKLYRVYPTDYSGGKEQELLSLDNENTLYSASPEGNRILYQKENNLYLLTIDSGNKRLFKTDTSGLNKITWLRSNTILSNLWKTEDGNKFTDLPRTENYYVDFGGEFYFYTVDGSVISYDILAEKEIKQKTKPAGMVLNAFF